MSKSALLPWASQIRARGAPAGGGQRGGFGNFPKMPKNPESGNCPSCFLFKLFSVKMFPFSLVFKRVFFFFFARFKRIINNSAAGGKGQQRNLCIRPGLKTNKLSLLSPGLPHHWVRVRKKAVGSGGVPPERGRPPFQDRHLTVGRAGPVGVGRGTGKVRVKVSRGGEGEEIGREKGSLEEGGKGTADRPHRERPTAWWREGTGRERQARREKKRLRPAEKARAGDWSSREA